MQVDRRYLNASFDVIDQRYGGINSFIRNELGISDKKRSDIIKKLTY
jgi:protein-tyrosine phosphatase